MPNTAFLRRVFCPFILYHTTVIFDSQRLTNQQIHTNSVQPQSPAQFQPHQKKKKKVSSVPATYLQTIVPETKKIRKKRTYPSQTKTPKLANQTSNDLPKHTICTIFSKTSRVHPHRCTPPDQCTPPACPSPASTSSRAPRNRAPGLGSCPSAICCWASPGGSSGNHHNHLGK